MAFFANFDPELPVALHGQGIVVTLIGLAFAVSFVGLAATTVAWLQHERANK
jgi:hypothetical protein